MAMCVLVSKNNRWAVKVGMLFGTSLPNNMKSMPCRQKKCVNDMVKRFHLALPFIDGEKEHKEIGI